MKRTAIWPTLVLLALFLVLPLAASPQTMKSEKGNVFTVAAKVYPKVGKEDEVQALLLKMAEAVRRAEPDNIVYRPHRSTKAPVVFFWYEQFRSDAAFEFHRTAPHLVDYRKQLSTLVDKPTEVEFYRSLAE